MIGFLRGIVFNVSEDQVILDVNNVGYNVIISARNAQAMPGIGQVATVYTYLSVREDAMKLYGFLSKDELDFFKLLIGVNSVGPKGAQAILSAMGPDELRFAILAGDAKAISKCPGVGAKTAQRIILDLKDKVDIEDALEAAAHGAAVTDAAGDSAAAGEAVEALMALGFGSGEALKAVRSADNGQMSVEELISGALAFLR